MERIRPLSVVALSVVAVLAAAGCGSGDVPRLAAPLITTGWSVEELGPAVDGRTAVAYVSRDEIVGLTVSAAGALQGWRSVDGGPFEAAPVGAAPVEGLFLTDVVVRDGQAVAIGSSLVDRRPRVFSSTDGGPWLELVTSGFDGPALAEDIVPTDDGFVVVGSRPRAGAEPGASTAFVPVAWRSTDARGWTDTVLPFGAEAGATGVTAIGEDLIAVGPGAPRDLVWRSSDGGATWTLVPAEVQGTGAGFRLREIATGRGVVLAIGSELGPRPSSVVVRSMDGGRTWLRVTGADGLDVGRHPARLAAGMSGFTLATSRSVGGFDPRRPCARRVPPCGGAGSVVLRSTNGDVWEELDLHAAPGLEQVDDVASHPSGRTVLLGRSRSGAWSAWVWPDGAGPPPVR